MQIQQSIQQPILRGIANPGYSPQAVELINSFPNPLTARDQDRTRLSVNAAVDLNVFGDIKTFAALSMDDPINSLWDWARKLTYTNVAGSTHTANQGYLFNGSTQYINTNFVPSTDGLLQDDTEIWAYCYKNFSAANNDTFFGASDGTRLLSINQQPTSSRFVYRVNNATGAVPNIGGNVFLDRTRYRIGRTNSTNQQLNIKGVVANDSAITSIGLPTKPYFIGGLNNNGILSTAINVSTNNEK